MKTLLSLIFLLIPFLSFAQPQAILRNAMSTNIAGTPVLSRNDLSITNVNGGTNWQFYGKTSNTVARLAEIDAARAYAESLAGAGSHFFFYGSLDAFGASLKVDPASLTNWALPDPSQSLAVLSSVNVTASDQYIVAYASTQTFSAVLAGSAEVNIWLYENSPGSLSVHAEFYAYDTVDETMTELGAGQPQVVTATGFPYQNMTWIVPVTALETGNPLRFVAKLKSSSVLLTPTLVLVTEGTYGSHMSVGVPLNLASKVDTLNGRATNLFVSASSANVVFEIGSGVDQMVVPSAGGGPVFAQGLTVGVDAKLTQSAGDLLSSVRVNAPEFRLTERESIIGDTTNFNFLYSFAGTPQFPVAFLPFGGRDGFAEFDDFSGGAIGGKIGWTSTTSGTGAGIALSAPAGNSWNYPGQARIGSGTTSGGRTVFFSSVWTFKLGTNSYWQEWTLYAPDGGTFPDSTALIVGGADATGTSYPTSGFWWQYDTNNTAWGAVSADASTYSTTNYLNRAAADEWIRLGLFYDGPNLKVYYFTNGVQASVNSTASTIPNNRSFPAALIRAHQAGAAASARFIYVDYFRHAMRAGNISSIRE